MSHRYRFFSSYRFLGRQRIGNVKVQAKLKCNARGYYTTPSQNAQNTPGGDHFWELRCRKSVRRCGAKHISRISTQQVHCETICLVDGLSQQGHCKL